MKKLYPVVVSLLFVFSLCFTVSCHKDKGTESSGKSMDQLHVPSNFNWETSHEVSLSVAVDIPSAIGTLSRIRVYDGDPFGTGKILISGSAGYNYPFVTGLRLPTALKQIYLELSSADGSSQYATVTIANNITYTFTGTKSFLKNYNSIAEPDCISSCDVTLSGSGSTTISGGKTYCVTGTFTGTITSWTSGTLKVCGTATIPFIKINTAGCNIIVTSGGRLTVDSLYMSSTTTLTAYQSAHVSIRGFYMAINSKIINYSNDFLFQAPFTFNGQIQNYGNMVLKGDATLQGTGGMLTNSGYFNPQGYFKVNAPLTNDGVIEVNNYLHLNKPDGSGSVNNNCRIISHANIHVYGATFVMNNGYMKSDQEVHLFQYTSTVTLQNQSMISSASFVMERNILGAGGTSTIKVTGTATLNDATKKVDGPIELATGNGTFTGSSSSTFVNGAKLTSIANATNYIPVSSCNPEGIGAPPPPDSDGDGVPNNLDAFPDDATRAYINYYPAKSQFGSIAYEDLWPAKGDYDMNDLVLDYNFKIISNAQNKIVDILPTFYVRAVGAYLQNGFGFQFDNLTPAVVGSVTGYSIKGSYISLASNGVENAQGNAVVIVFDNASNVTHATPGNFFNTQKNVPYALSDSIKMTIHFATPQDASAVGTAPYNPFLIKNLQRNVEIHLPDRIPTSLANQALFGTGNDNSNPATGRYYKTSANLPWAINLVQKFDYTWENVQVITGYLQFGNWAESGGSSYPDWYMNLSGYRDAAQIYVIQSK
ncbi:MAG: LruC domain-containing protein [Bacteroidetes bacterium]|nr:LruC domain-containing protein [Bacteroidota bacterium]